MPPNTFEEARHLRNPPRLITFLEFDTGASQATLSGFDRPWRVVGTGSGLGLAVATCVANPRLEGTKSFRVQVRTGDTLSMVATTLTTPVNLSALETIRLFVRSDKTGLPMRLGLGESSAGQFLPDLAAIATVNAFVEREVTITSLPATSRDAITKLRLEIYGAPGAGKGTALVYFDKMFAVKRNRYANIFQARPGVALPGDALDVDVSGSAAIAGVGHAMDNTVVMDDSSAMSDGVSFSSDFSEVNAVDLSQQNSLSANFSVSSVPATLRFGFGEASSGEQTFDFTIVTAGVSVARSFSLTGITQASRDGVRFFSLTPLSVPTTNPDFTASLDSLIAQRYYTPSPILPYRVFLEKVLAVTPITQSLAPIQSRMNMASTKITLANTDGEFYRLRDTVPMLNRGVRLFSGFENHGEQEMQTMFLGSIRNESLNDNTYDVEAEDAMSQVFHDLPVNVTSAQTGVFTKAFNRPIPVVFGKVRKIFPAPIAFTSGGAPTAIGATIYQIGKTTWYMNDPNYGKSVGISTLYYQGKAVPSIGVLWGIGPAGVGTAYILRNWSQVTSQNLLITWGVSSHPEKITIDMQGYKDDADGSYTGTPGTLIENPSDIYRFSMQKILGIDPAMIDFSSLDSARTLMQGYKVGRAIRDRQNSLQIFGGSPARDGLAQNMLLYFFQSNVSGKMLVQNAQTPTSIATAGSYFATGRHSNVLKGSYRKRANPERMITRIEVDYNYAMASGTFADNIQIVDPDAETLAGSNKKDVYKILGRWIGADQTPMHISYLGTAIGGATLTIIGEGTSSLYQLRIVSSSANPAQTFTVDLEGASGNTLARLKTTIDNKAHYAATLNTSIVSTMDARGLRNLKGVSLATAKHLKYSLAKNVAAKYLDEYATNRDQITWRSPWVSYLQELGSFVQVRSLAEPTTRRVRIMQTMRDPLSGTMELRGEEV